MNTGRFKVNSLISDRPPTEAAAPSKTKSAGGMSKPQGTGKPKVKAMEVAGSSKAKAIEVGGSSKAKAIEVGGSSKAKAIEGGGSSKPKATAAVGSSKPPPQAAFVLVPECQTTVYANPKFSGPNAIEEKAKGETLMLNNKPIIWLTRSAQRQVE